jgi:hypothetical protein
MYKENCKLNKDNNSMSHLQFRSQLANELIGKYSNRQKYGYSPGRSSGRKQNVANGKQTIENRICLTNVGNHLPVTGTCNRCGHCRTKKNKKRSTTACTACNVALCKECIVPFHKSKENCNWNLSK